MNRVFHAFKYFEQQILLHAPKADRELWEADWKRDFAVYSSIFEMVADMNDEQRDAVETFCTAIASGEEIIIEHKETAAA